MKHTTENDSYTIPELPGATCHRAAFLVDAEDYFRAFSQAAQQAKRQILIIGWDIDSRIKLEQNGEKVHLYQLLNSIVSQRPDVQVYVLIWDYPLAYSMDREPLQALNFPRKTHRNIHFRLDSELPLGSSHHQKVVVVDDKVAFCGGMDLTAARWDTHEHAPKDQRRKTPGGDDYGPYHDIQMLVDGNMARMLGDMARERWLWATEKELPPPEDTEEVPWPESVEPELHDQHMGMALTLPPFKGRPAKREVEQVYLSEIARARSHIFMENQYFTSDSIKKALVERLKEEDGPEIFIILSKMTTGLLEQLVMDPLQSKVLDDLREADAHGRLAVHCPFADSEGEVPIKIHSKLLMVDDESFTVGSANLNDRSMGLDSECNLVLRNAELRDTLRGLRHGFVAHHFGLGADEFGRREEEQGSMVKAAQTLSEETCRAIPEKKTRNRPPLPVDPDMARPLDSSRPGLYDSIMDEYTGSDNSRHSHSRLMVFGAILAGFIVLALAWRYTPLSEYATPGQLLELAREIRTLPFSPLLAVLCFVIGGFIMLPVTLMILLTASIFSPFPAFLISLTGCIASSLLIYFTGSALGHESVKRLAGSRINTVSKQLGKHGLPSILIVRVLPVAPFSIINLVAGASHISLPVFIWGTVLGMVPGIIGMTLFGGQLMAALRDPGPGTITVLVLIVVAVLALGELLRRRLRRLQREQLKDAPETTEEEAVE